MRMNDSMADRTKDIWNDSPEEEQKKPKRQKIPRQSRILLRIPSRRLHLSPKKRILVVKMESEMVEIRALSE